jgi:hypothetical protein
MVVVSSCRVLLMCRLVKCMRVAFVLPKPIHNNIISTSDVNMMC